jgi:parallel beta-helix repeat protein
MKQLRKEQVEGARRYNVLDYGIKPTTLPDDNTTLLNDLILKVAQKGGGEIYFPAGVYNFRSEIYLKNNITISGDGWGTVLQYVGLGDFFVIGETDLTKKYENITIRDLYLKCVNSSNTGSGIKLVGGTTDWNNALEYTPRKIFLINLRIEEFGYAGVDVDLTCIYVFYHNLFVRKNGRFGIKVGVDCDVSHCFVGENGVKYPSDFYNCNILVAGGDTRITDCHIWGWGAEKGILIYLSSDVHISNCVIEEHSKEGIFIYNSSTCRIQNNYLEDNSFGNTNTYSAIKIVGNSNTNLSYYNIIKGNRFGKQISGGIQASHKYCVEEEGSYVDYTIFEDNITLYGYQTAPVYLVGSHSVASFNEYTDISLEHNIAFGASFSSYSYNTPLGLLKFENDKTSIGKSTLDTWLDVLGDIAIKHIKLLYFSTINNRFEIGDVSGTLLNPDTLRLKAVNNIDFYTQSNQRVLINSSGNVYIAQKLGVKNMWPYFDVDVNGSIRAYNDIIAHGFLRAVGYYGDLYMNSGLIGQTGYDLYIGTLTANNLRFITNNSEKVLIDSSGNVYIAQKLGVKNSSPYYEVDVFGSIRASNNLIALGVLDLEGAMGALVCQSGLIKQGGYDLVLGTETANNIRFITNNLERFRVDRLGNVGIGIINPMTSLHIKGFFTPAYMQQAIQSTADDDRVGISFLNAVGSRIGYLAVESGGSMFLANEQGESLILQNLGGNVGIGTLEPTAKLHIQGLTGYNQLRLATSYTPTGTNDGAGYVGDFAWDDNYLYIKTSVGWKRAALSTF